MSEEIEKLKARFLTGSADAQAATPEELWYELPRKQSHTYPRGQQQDVLRDYAEVQDRPDIALELPTGTGKTTVGLVIGEWRRRRNRKPVAYLTVTNQLAHQVMAEAEALGIATADLTGGRATRNQSEVGRYKTGDAIGVASYSNLSNINPVIQRSDLLILDDAHGGEESAAEMWTVEVSRAREDELYLSAKAALTPAISPSQWRLLGNKNRPNVVMAAVASHPEVLPPLMEAFDQASESLTRWAWGQIRDHLAACLFLVSKDQITIRPLIPPTWSHAPFAESGQRLFMSATIGGVADLQRAYGIARPATLKAAHAPSGRRFVFVPELHADYEEAVQSVGEIWDQLEPKRALLLAPSHAASDAAFESVSAHCATEPQRLTADDIADSMVPFTSRGNAMLTLAGRYDGIDLPDDSCRLALMVGSPVAVSDLERHLADSWGLKPVLRNKERVRLMQGLGRCTRSASDYSFVIWMRPSLVDASTDEILLGGLPKDLRAEIIFGRDQSAKIAEDQPGFVELITDMMASADLREAATGVIRTRQESLTDPQFPGMEQLGDSVGHELSFARALWSGNFEVALVSAQTVIDTVTDTELAGYRGLWGLLAANAALYGGNQTAALDLMKRALGCGVNTGFLSEQVRTFPEAQPEDQGHPTNAEGVLKNIARLGWTALTFSRTCSEMLERLGGNEATTFHMGLEELGNLLGASSVRSTASGVPDVVWTFDDGTCLTFEAKTEKTSPKLAKREVQQAVGHVNWATNELGVEPERTTPVAVTTASELQGDAVPHVGDLRVVDPEDLRQLGQQAVEAVSRIRSLYRSEGAGSVTKAVASELATSGLDIESIVNVITKRRLAER